MLLHQSSELETTPRWLGAESERPAIGPVRSQKPRDVGTGVRAIGKGLVPISVGLVFATGWVLLRGSGSWDWRGATLAFVAAAIIYRTKINPVWVIAAGAAVGVAGFA